MTLALGGERSACGSLGQVEKSLDFSESLFFDEKKAPAAATTGRKKLVLIPGTGFLTEKRLKTHIPIEQRLKTHILDRKIVKKRSTTVKSRPG